MEIEKIGAESVGFSYGVNVVDFDDPIAGKETDYFVWVEPFRDLYFEEFKARELYAEKRQQDLRDEFGRILEAAEVGSLIQTGDGKYWRVVMVNDGYDGKQKKAIVPDTSGRASRRAEFKTKKRKFR